MSRQQGRAPRKPATKFAHLQKKLRQIKATPRRPKKSSAW